jgi:hypothetical protein
MQNLPVARILGRLVDSLPPQNSTSGGSSDTDATDWHVRPTGPSSSQEVTITIPVQKWPITSRNRRLARLDPVAITGALPSFGRIR